MSDRKYIIKYILYSIILLFLLATLAQNFLISRSLGFLSFREIDDLAFQHVIRRVHLLIYKQQYMDLLKINDFGYGWIYWIFISIATFPFYILSKVYEIDWPLISAPRQISWLFSVLSLLVMARLLKRSGVSPTGVAAGSAIFCLFPTMGYFSMRFGTVSSVAFFALLSFYFAWTDRPSTQGGRICAMLSLAIAGAIKLNGLLIAPLIGCLIVSHLSDRSISGIIKATMLPIVTFILFWITLTNPLLIYAPFDATIISNYLIMMKSYLVGNATARDTLLPIHRFYQGALGSPINALIMGALAIGIIISMIRNKTRRIDYIITLSGISFICIYLMLTVKHSEGMLLYITAGIFLLILGVTGWDGIRKGFVLYSIIALMLIDTSIHAIQLYEMQYHPLSHLRHFNYFFKRINISFGIKNAQFINLCIPSLTDRNWEGHIFSDFTLPLLVNGLTNPNTCFSVSYNNLSSDKKYCGTPIDYLILDKHAPGSLPDEPFKQYLSSLGSKNISSSLEDRQSRVDLDRDGKFGNQLFTIKCETDRVKIFISQQKQ